MDAIRTSDDRFQNLPDFPYVPNYISDLPGYTDLRMHYVDDGPAEADEVFLCLHGEPTWSFLYRKMIPVFSAAGTRSVAPDFYGFGRSDKPVADEDYGFIFHRNSILSLIGKLDLQHITLVCQDWGGLIGLTLPMEMPERFDRLILMNTTFGVGEGVPSEGFANWKAFAASAPDLDVGQLMQRSRENNLTDREVAAYDAPFPDITYKAGVRRFPEIVPVSEDMEGADISRAARQWFRDNWKGQSFMAIGEKDQVLGTPLMMALHDDIPGCPKPLVLPEAGHFVQEHGDQVARAALQSFAGG